MGPDLGDFFFGGFRSLHATNSDVDEDGLGCVRSHGCDTGVWPSKQEPGVEASATHAVVASAVGTANKHGVTRHRCVCDSSNHLGTVLGDAALLAVAADHVAAGVLQEHERHPALLAQFNEVGGLKRRLAKDDAVVRDDADEMAPNTGEATHDRLAPLGLKSGEPASVDDTSDDLGGIERDAIIGADDAVDLFGCVRRWFRLNPVEPAITLIDPPLVCGLADLTKFAVCLAFGRRHVVAHAADAGVQHGTAEVIGIDDLPQRRFHDWRATEKDPADAFDHDDFVAQGRHIRTSSGAAAKHHR